MAAFGHQTQREAVEQHIAAAVEDLLVLSELVFAVAYAVYRHDFQECQYLAQCGFAEDVGPRQEHGRLGREAEHRQRFHQCLLVAGSYDIGAVLGQILFSAHSETVVVAPAAKLYQWT